MKNKSVQLPMYADNVTLPAFTRHAAVRRAAIYRYLLLVEPTAANV